MPDGIPAKIASHRGVAYWDYFIKNVQIDYNVFYPIANVRKKSDNSFVYSIQLNENKKIEASPSLGLLSKASNRMLNASAKDDSTFSGESQYVSHNNSDRDPNYTDNRTLLSNALASTAKNDIERKYIEQYQSKIDTINEEQKKLTELRTKIKNLSFAKGKRDAEQIRNLQSEATKSANRINIFDKQLLRLEASRPLIDVLQRERDCKEERSKAVSGILECLQRESC